MQFYILYFSSTTKDCVDNEKIKLVSTSGVSCAPIGQEPCTSITEPLIESKLRQQRPLLVKQKQSFRFPGDEGDPEAMQTQLPEDVANVSKDGQG